MSAANWCKCHDLSQQEAVAKIRENLTRSPSPHNEIEKTVTKVYAEAPLEPGECFIPTTRVPPLDPARRQKAIAENTLTVSDLIASSPFKLSKERAQTEEIIDILFPGNPLLCVGKSAHRFAIRTREKWRGRLSEFPLIVPNPMSARFGMTQEGKRSEHSLDNTGPRRFFVVEQDNGGPDQQVSVLSYLAEFLNLVLVVYSGSRSTHGWFFVEGLPEPDLDQFMNLACRLGACHSTRPKSQFVRLPGGTRDNGRHQRVLFFDRKALCLPPGFSESMTQLGERATSATELPTERTHTQQPVPPEDSSRLETLADNAVNNEALEAAASLFPPVSADALALLARRAPPYGEGLFPWIKLAAQSLLPGHQPQDVARIIYLATHDQKFPITELLALQSNHSSFR
jgi:hypothetical protein